MAEKNQLQFCATKIERHVLKTLKDVAFERQQTLRDLLRDILTNFANENAVKVTKHNEQ